MHNGPILVVQPDGVFYRQVRESHVPTLVTEHFVGGRPLADILFVPKDEKVQIPSLRDIPFFKDQRLIALRNRGLIDPDSIDEYIANDGYKAIAKALTSMTPQAVIDEIRAACGAAAGRFPTGRGSLPNLRAQAACRTARNALLSSATPTRRSRPSWTAVSSRPIRIPS